MKARCRESRGLVRNGTVPPLIDVMASWHMCIVLHCTRFRVILTPVICKDKGLSTFLSMVVLPCGVVTTYRTEPQPFDEAKTQADL